MNTAIESPIELNLCHYCGCKVDLMMNEDKDGFWTSCPNCWAEGPFARTPEEASEWFNNGVAYKKSKSGIKREETDIERCQF